VCLTASTSPTEIPAAISRKADGDFREPVEQINAEKYEACESHVSCDQRAVTVVNKIYKIFRIIMLILKNLVNPV
jgi:hypothetical protein